MEKYYYTCDMYSVTGKRIQKFWNKAMHAARRADDYAKKYGAKSYVQPFEHFEGGVDYMEFEKTPDLSVWRKAITTPDGIDEYEPNCFVRADILIIPDDRFQPSDTWDKTYFKNHLTWEVAKPKKTLAQWAAIIHYELTGNDDKDHAYIDEHLCNCFFVPFLQYYGEQEGCNGKTVPQSLRKAIKAEKDRVALPIVNIGLLYSILGMEIPSDPEELASFASEALTPTFFLYKETFYIAAPRPCKGEGLHPSDEAAYNVNFNLANRAK